nr:superoxide dismutase family protein [uncultured Duganella sp.]
MKIAVVSCILSMSVMAAASAATLSAEAPLKPTAGSKVSGTVAFEQDGDKLNVKARIEGLTPGLHGFHIHEKGDCSAPDGTSAGGHFNPATTQHGDPAQAAHHGGDFGNIKADDKGVAEFSISVPTSQINLANGSGSSVIGRSMIVHAAPDDMVTQPTGNSGARLACGVIAAK